MKLPDWLPEIGVRDEKLRAAAGLIPKKDGWYKTFDGRTSYICKPCSVSEVAAILDNRIDAIRRKRGGGDQPVTLTRVTPGTLTLDALAEMYQAWLYQRLTTGIPRKLARRTYDDAIREIDVFVECAGPDKPADSIGEAEFSAYALKHLAGIATSSIRRKMIYIEAFANWAAPGSRKAGLLVRPWRYGADFRKPSDHEITTSAADSDKAYTPEQIRRAFLRVRKIPLMRAVGWLALCGAFSPKDLGTLPEKLVNLDTGFIAFPRGKTGIGRLCWLTPAARVAVGRYLKVRPDACDESAKGLLFRTDNGLPYYRDAQGVDAGHRYDAIGRDWHKFTKLPLSGLRSTFATLADDWPDQRVVDVVMGHKSGHQVRSVRNKHYAKKISPERVQKLVSAVVPLAFGRKTPSPASSTSPAPQPLPPVAPSATPATSPRRRGRSSTAGEASQANAHQMPPARRT